jgi:deferrochelatase/peroxidase EfeB
MSGCPFDFSRRVFIGSAGAAAAGLTLAAAAPETHAALSKISSEPFRGAHQGGIASPAQAHSTFAAFDLTTGKREDVIALLKVWTEAAAKLTGGQPIAALATPADAEPGDSGDALELPRARLTITFGFGPGLFIKDDKDRYGLARRRPEALIDLPRFNGDQLVPERTGGDLSVQACADDPQVAFHAVRQLARLAYEVAQIRWTQNGFVPSAAAGTTPRNLMGFKDGTMNIPVRDHKAMEKFVWVGDEGGWMRGGSYVVARPIRIALEHWDRMKLAFQEQTMGRQKYSGAPLGGKREFDGLNLAAMDADGNPTVPENAHARLAAPESNDGAQILRRPYSYDNGVSFTAERWPPWRQGMEFDAGLFFVCYQRDPRTGFVKIFDRMAKFDMLNQFVTHVGGGLFACPPGAGTGQYIGQGLFEAA